jgi:hypothetical protein
VRCNAGPGWDGPTGVGTPNGVSALALGPAGELAGRVTAGRRSLAGADVTLTDDTGYRYHTVTDAHGRYELAVAAGSYRVEASKFGFSSHTVDRLVVTADRKVRRSFALDRLATRTVTGTVADGSGQGWPIYAEIAIQGHPGRAVYTDPYTGKYRVELPVGSTYQINAKPVDMPGYVEQRADIVVARGRGPIVRDVSVGVDPETCIAAGYAYAYAGAGTGFEGWSSPEDDWSVTDEADTGKVWVFDDPGAKGNLTGGSGQFAIVDNWQFPAPHDTSLVSPALDLSDQDSPEIGFDTYYYDYGFGDQDGDVDLSLDGGSTWQNVWHAPDEFVQGHVAIPIPQAAGKTGVLVRFRFTGKYDNYWELDNVFVGFRSCEPVAGGLVAGIVRDDNTGAPLTGAEVTADGGATGVTQATSDDPRVADGFYWLYSVGSGPASLSASGQRYADATDSVVVSPGHVVRHDWRLRAGELRAVTRSLDVRTHGEATTRKVTLRNTGTEPVRVTIAEQDRGFIPLGGHDRTTSPGAPLQRTKVDASPFAFDGHGGGGDAGDLPPRDASNNPAWSDLPDYPTPIMDNVVAEDDGIVYSVAGVDDTGMTGDGYAFDLDRRSWRPIAPLPEARENAVGGFVDGKLYVAGGWDPTGTPTRTTYAYDPTHDAWTRVADLPGPKSVGASSVSGGQLYVVAGCGDAACEDATATYRYDPGADSWSEVADYPQDVVMLGCAGSGEGLVCAGGTDPLADNPTAATYQYVASFDTWTRVADLPYSSWGMGYAGSGGKLQLVGGIVHYDVTNQAIEYDPATGQWSALPNATYSMYRGGAACGLTRVGGSISSFTAAPYAERRPGHDACIAGDDVGWLSVDRTELTVPPGRSVTVRVRLDGAATSTRGDYLARLAFATDTPYSVKPVRITLSRRGLVE